MNCKYCGKEVTRGNNRTVFCSDKCRIAYWKVTKGLELGTVKCIDCGADVVTTQRWKYKPHRCDECARVRREAHMLSDNEKQERAERRREEARLSYYTSGKRESLKEKTKQKHNVAICANCGIKFEQSRSSQMYCSQMCAKSTSKFNRSAKLRIKDKESAIRAHYVFRHNVIKQHGYICGICGQQIDKGLKYPHPYSFCIDHIKPLAIGGAHELSNLQPAHFICNSLKGISYSEVK